MQLIIMALIICYFIFRGLVWISYFIFKLLTCNVPREDYYEENYTRTLPPPIDDRSPDEIDRDWIALLDLSKLVNNIYEKILYKYSIDCCSSCGHNTYILNDVDTSKVTLECTSCSEEIEKHNHMYNNKTLGRYFTQFLEYEPMYYYNLSDVLDRYDEIDPDKLSRRNNIIKKLNSIKNKTFRNYDENKPMTLTGFDILIKANV